MPSPRFLLYEALVAEYESQGTQPPFPHDELTQRRRRCEEELAPLRERDPDEYERQLDAALVKEVYAWQHRHGGGRSALCFSGGGIRSATFGLGVIQGLARCGLLGKFDYLSTVSGGGYLGSWLTGWIHRVRLRLGDPGLAVQEVEERLRSLPESPLDPEPEPVRYLRSYSRYMSPKLGLLSADTWTLIAIFMRNLLLNWLVLLPLIAAVLVIPRLSVILVRLGSRPWFQGSLETWALPAVLWAAIGLGAWAIAYMAANRPSLEKHSRFPQRLKGQSWFVVLCLLPLGLMAILASLYWAWIRAHDTPLENLRFVVLGWEVSPAVAFTLFGVLVHFGGFLLSRLWVRRYVFGELFIVALTGALGGISAWLLASHLFPTVNTGFRTELYACVAAPLLLFVFLLASTLFVGLSSYFTDEADREWLARSGAWVLIAIFVRSAFSAIVIFGPVAVIKAGAMITSALGGVSGLVTLVLGQSARTKPNKSGQPAAGENRTSSVLNLVLSLAAPLFAVFVFVALSLGTTWLVRLVTDTFDPGHAWHLGQGFSYDRSRLLNIVYYSPWWAVCAVLGILLFVGLLMGAAVDINRFSLHAAYRDRLIRAFLGASRGKERRPDLFTGFDPLDNIPMSQLRGNRPFHVVNMTLNLVGGKDLALQDRKAETFTASPLHAGNFNLGYRDAAEYGLHRTGNVAISLGTAVAISGAAASPSMGYHSSPVVTFLLALFNVRLGWWLGNPGKAGDGTYNTPGPRFAPRPFFAEAFGLTDDQHPYVYLSDGGHFENLGIYEMVLRRCRLIVVSDGGQDPDFTFEDLGNAVAKVRVDLGVPIKFAKILMLPRSKEKEPYDVERHRDASRPYCAIGRICYSCVDSVSDGKVEDGLLLYIKPSLNGTEPADVYHYAQLHPQFPHEPTSDQFFSESQFESYRELGLHVMRSILGELGPGASLEDLFKQVEAQLGQPPSCA